MPKTKGINLDAAPDGEWFVGSEDEQRYYTLRGVSAVIGFPRKEVYKLIREGKLPSLLFLEQRICSESQIRAYAERKSGRVI